MLLHISNQRVTFTSSMGTNKNLAVMKNFTAQWFQYPSGVYLDLDNSFNSVKKIQANSLEDAIEIAKEFETEDSELPFTDRVLVTEDK